MTDDQKLEAVGALLSAPSSRHPTLRSGNSLSALCECLRAEMVDAAHLAEGAPDRFTAVRWRLEAVLLDVKSGCDTLIERLKAISEL